jgi:large subunit ribosomal protein L19
MNITDIMEVKVNPKIPSIAPGDTVKVRQKVVEGEKSRIQVFQGVVIKVRHGGAGASFTVRRVTYGVGVERTFPIYSPMIEGVEVVRHGKVRRAKLYYLRGLSSRASRIKERRVEKFGEAIASPEEQETAETPAETVAPAQAEAQAQTVTAAPAQPEAKAPAPTVAQQPAAPATEPPKAQAEKPAETPNPEQPQH